MLVEVGGGIFTRAAPAEATVTDTPWLAGLSALGQLCWEKGSSGFHDQDVSCAGGAEGPRSHSAKPPPSPELGTERLQNLPWDPAGC